MFSKVALSIFAVGALFVNALAVPVARSPAPQPESSPEWGTDYSGMYRSPGLPRFKREPGIWSDLDHLVSNYTAPRKVYNRQLGSLVDQRKHHTQSSQDDPPADTDGLHFLKREPGMWAQLDEILGDSKSRPRENSKRQLVDWVHHIKSSSSDLDQGSHHNSKREPSPEPESWEEWGTNVGNYYANKYGTPGQVPGLPRPWLNNKREPESWAERDQPIGDYYSAPRKNSRRDRPNQPSPNTVHGDPHLGAGGDHVGNDHVGDNHGGDNHGGNDHSGQKD